MNPKPRGLIFCQDLIPGVMNGTVTVTSRIMKPQPVCDDRAWAWYPSQGPPYGPVPWGLNEPCPLATDPRCPFRVGEKRYVKEAWYCDARGGLLGYPADGDCPHGEPYRVGRANYMLVTFARTWVEIVTVKPARCQDITREEVLASGIVMDPSGAWCQGVRTNCYETSRDAYAAFWDRLNGKPEYVKGAGFGGETLRVEPHHRWQDNPWVWRCTFRLCEAAK